MTKVVQSATEAKHSKHQLQLKHQRVHACLQQELEGLKAEQVGYSTDWVQPRKKPKSLLFLALALGSSDWLTLVLTLEHVAVRTFSVNVTSPPFTK